jgi:hypothetical protein
MKKGLTFALILVGVVGVLLVAKGWTPSTKRVDPKIAHFNEIADSLILGIQQYREFTGTYPTGNNAQIAKALMGQGEKKVLILAIRKAPINDKGEVLDPWGTPLAFYFGNNEVLIRSAGPNKAWEDSAIATADDLYRTVGIDRK